jgi:site-specific DNA-methyltransferase (adenine-specific)
MEIKENEIYNCDCLDIMKEMVKQGIVVDWLITDPPYGISVNNNMGRRKGDKNSDYKKAYWDTERLSKEYFDLMFKVSKNQIIWGGNYYTDYLTPTPCWIIWDKMFSDDVSFAQVEMAWTNQKSSAKKVVCFPNGGEEDRIHPTQKPLKVIQFCINKYTKEGDTILDPFMGSFTTAVACHKLNRKYIGAEKDKEYFEKGTERLNKVKSQISMFD